MRRAVLLLAALVLLASCRQEGEETPPPSQGQEPQPSQSEQLQPEEEAPALQPVEELPGLWLPAGDESCPVAVIWQRSPQDEQLAQALAANGVGAFLLAAQEEGGQPEWEQLGSLGDCQRVQPERLFMLLREEQGLQWPAVEEAALPVAGYILWQAQPPEGPVQLYAPILALAWEGEGREEDLQGWQQLLKGRENASFILYLEDEPLDGAPLQDIRSFMAANQLVLE